MRSVGFGIVRILASRVGPVRPLHASASVATLVLRQLSALLHAQQRPNILLDHARHHPRRSDGVPRLDARADAGARRLARSAIVFKRAYAQAPITTVSHATILTGTYPPFHRVNDFGAPLPRRCRICPSFSLARLSDGARSSARWSSIRATDRAGLRPRLRSLRRRLPLRRPGEDRYDTLERRGDEVRRAPRAG